MESAPQSHDKASVEYFNRLAHTLRPEMRLLFEGGKLWKKDNWRNVAEHCLLQAAASEVITEQLKLPAEERERIVKTAAVHDWAKRLEKKPDEFTPEEREEAEALLAKTGMDPLLMDSTGPDFFVKTHQYPETVTLPERVQCYIDDITSNNQIVPLLERLAEVESRRQDLNEDQHYTEVFGKPFFDYVREYETGFEEQLFEMLKEQGANLERHEDIPDFINQELERRMHAEKV